jgi:hypothetical protein
LVPFARETATDGFQTELQSDLPALYRGEAITPASPSP